MRVKPRQFDIRDLVLRKVTLATRDPTQGKLGPNWEGPYKVIEIYRRGIYHLEAMDERRLPHSWNIEHLKKYYPKARLAKIVSVSKNISNKN